MLGIEDMLQIKILHQQGYSNRKIAKQLGLSRNTVKRYLASMDKEPTYKARPIVKGKLTDYSDYLQQRQQAASPDWIPATVLYREISGQGYQGSLSLLRQYLRGLKTAAKDKPLIRFETPPGKQMQVDWAEFNRGHHRLSALIATLGYSRMSYVEFVNNQRLDTLLRCLLNAFDYFGGVTQELLFDNMKTVVTERNAYGTGYHRFQAKLWDFAKHYGFIPKLCQPYRAQTKGKVERFIHYLRHSFYLPLQATLTAVNLNVDVVTANQEVKRWLASVANCRLHATTQQRPIDLFEEEKTALLSLPVTAYAGLAKVAKNCPIPNYVTVPILQTPLQHDLMLYQALLNQTIGGTL